MMNKSATTLGRLRQLNYAIPRSTAALKRPVHVPCMLLSSSSTTNDNSKIFDHLKKSPAFGAVDVGGAPSNSSVPSTSAIEHGTVSERHKECGEGADNEDLEMEQEDMFVEAHESFEYKTQEWGGPRRGGRLPEPTRYGDWERKGRCTDFS